MRKIILQVAVTLDGFIEGPNGEYDWCFTDQDYGMKAFLKRIDAIFYGRKSYEMMSGLAPEAGGGMFGGKVNYVFSNTLKKISGAEVISGDLVEEVNKIKNLAGGDIWLFGGASLTKSLINAGLVDELSLAVHPLLLGSGKLLFEGIAERIKLNLLDTIKYDTGLVMLNYGIAN